MIDIVESMTQQRTEFIKYCSDILSSESMLWVKRLFSNINKKIAIDKDDVLAVKVWPLYSGITKFFKDFADEVTAGSILLTLYICSIELGVLGFGDQVETFDDFTDFVDIDDWESVSYEDLLKLDLYSESVIVYRMVSCDYDHGTVLFCGLRTLSLLDYVGVESD